MAYLLGIETNMILKLEFLFLYFKGLPGFKYHVVFREKKNKPRKYFPYREMN